MKHLSETPYLRERLCLSTRPAPEIPAAAKRRLEIGPSFQIYVMAFFHEFLLRFCRGQDFSNFSVQPEGTPSAIALEDPQIALARYLCNLHHQIFRRGLAGVPIRWKKRMSFAARKVALLQRSFMWLLYFARMRVRGKLYSVLIGIAHSRAASVRALGTSASLSANKMANESLKPP